MKLELAMNILIFACSLIGSAYGMFNFFREKKALYLKLVTCGVMSLMFSRLYQVVFLTTQGNLNSGFHIGLLGTIGSFMFFFSANYGQMDGIVDDRTNAFRKTRIISLIAPLLILLIYLFFLIKVNNTELRIVWGIVTFFIMQCAYYNFKHIIIYDVELGIIKVLRKYNILVLAYAFLIMLEAVGLYMDIKPLYTASCVCIGFVAVALLPVLKGGVKKWTI